MTKEIQNTLNRCNANGGGTVWLERGIYIISSPITIPSMCTLMGDWQNPDNYQGVLDYGTKIVVDVKKFKSDNNNLEETGLFKMKSSSGVIGITIYYKNQNINNPIAQPWSFYYTTWVEDYSRSEPSMLFTIKNVTLINAYRGIGRSLNENYVHEMLIIENVKGTILHRGVVIHASSDVGTISGLSLDSKYWANANLKAFSDSSSNYATNKIVNSIKSNGGIGMIITDIELSQYADIEISGYKYGIYLPNAAAKNITTRGSGSVVFYHLNIHNCERGIFVEEGTHPVHNSTMLDYRSGYLIANSHIEGSDYAIYNNSSSVMYNGKKYVGTLKLHDVEIQGKVGGNGDIIYNNGSSGNYISMSKEIKLTGKITNINKFSLINTYRNLKTPGYYFAYLSSNSNVDTINNTLNDISKKGGGVVYLKPGRYTINKTIYIPANVELRGSSAVSTRIYSMGTVFDVVADRNNVFRAVVIDGNNSGISGINFIYQKSIDQLQNKQYVDALDYSIFVENVKNVYVKNISLAASNYGIYFNKCNNLTVENIVATAFRNYLRIDNSSNGLVRNILSNINVLGRNHLYHVNDFDWNYAMDYNLHELQFMFLKGSTDIELENCFAFRPNRFLEVENSSFYAVNMSHDDSMLGATFVLNNNSNGVIVNALKWSNCAPINNIKSSNLGIYNPMTIFNVGEKDILNKPFKLAKKYLEARISLSSKKITLSKGVTKVINYRYDGDGKLSCKSSDDSVVKCSIDLNKKGIIIKALRDIKKDITITISGTSGQNYAKTSANIAIITSSLGDINSNYSFWRKIF